MASPSTVFLGSEKLNGKPGVTLSAWLAFALQVAVFFFGYGRLQERVDNLSETVHDLRLHVEMLEARR